MTATTPIEDLSELWKSISPEARFELDFSVHQGRTPEAVNRCMCSVKGMTLTNAMRLVSRREVELRKES